MTLDEYRKLMDGVPSAWRGHEEFAGWLVQEVRAMTTVELGVNLGFSLFALARPGVGKMYGVDSFLGRTSLDIDDKKFVTEKLPLFPNVELIVEDFTSLSNRWDHDYGRYIDVLHIDGHHHYEAVNQDWENWHKHVRSQGVTILHDTRSFPDGVGRLFDEIKKPKVEFTHSCGLGVVGPPDLLVKIAKKFDNVET